MDPLSVLRLCVLDATVLTPIARLFEGNTDAAEAKVWKRANPKISDDFFIHVRQLLVPQATSDSATEHATPNGPFISSQPLQLTIEALNALSGALGKRGRGLTVSLSKAACRRLRDMDLGNLVQDGAIIFNISDAYLHLFGTGIGCIVLNLKLPVPKLPIQLLVEALHACARTAAKAQSSNPIRWKSEENFETSGTSLDAIVRSLCPVLKNADLNDWPVPLSWDRIFSYTAVSLDSEIQDPALRVSTVFRFSRRYTSDYLPTTEEINRCVARPFRNIAHAESIEGGCVLVEESSKKNRLHFRLPKRAGLCRVLASCATSAPRARGASENYGGIKPSY